MASLGDVTVESHLVMPSPSDQDMLRALERTLDGFAAAVGRLTNQWDMPSPCAGWTIRDVVDHVVRGDLYGAAALRGLTLADAVDESRGLGPHPANYLAEVVASAETVLDAFSGSLDRPVEHPVGTVSARRYLGFRILDQLGHTWDVEMPAFGSSDLDPFAVGVAFKIAQAERETLERSANFDVQVDLTVDPADPLVGFLALIGRTP